MFAAAAAAAEVAEAFIAQRRALIDAEGPVDDHRRGGHAVVERGGIDEGLDRRARLAFGLRRAIEGRQADVEAALLRIDTARMRAFDDHAARYRSEEHTSALQSLMRHPYAAFCLRKKNTKI